MGWPTSNNCYFFIQSLKIYFIFFQLYLSLYSIFYINYNCKVNFIFYHIDFIISEVIQ